MKSINIQFPLTDDTEKNKLFKLNYVSKDAIISNLMFLFKTKRGQRYYMSDFGTNLEKHLFQPKDDITQDDIIEDLKESVRKFMPQITINNVSFFTNENSGYEDLDDSELTIIVSFTFSDDVFSNQGTIELTF